MAEDTTDESMQEQSWSLGGGFTLTLSWPAGADAEEGTTTLVRAAALYAGALATMRAKTVHYGNAWQRQGWMGNFARIMSKVARLQNMVWKELAAQDSRETVEDTAQDLINLTAFFTLNRQAGNRWGS